MATSKEWDLKRAEKEWVPQTRPVQHVGVPGYQWQTAVMWDGSLGFGPFGFRKIEEFPGARIEKYWEEIERLGNSRLHLSFAYGEGARLFDFAGNGSAAVKRRLEDGNLPIPHIETREGGIEWEETVYAHLLDRAIAEGMEPRADDVLVTHAAFTALNKTRKPRTARLWMHFGDASQVRFGYKVFVGATPGPALAHELKGPFGMFEGKARYVLPEPSAGRFVFHDEARPEQFKAALKNVIEWQAELAPGASASMEIMLPYSGVDMDTARRILSIDRGKALSRTRAFWKGLVESCDRISVPDEFVGNYAAAAPAQMAQQVAYRHTTGAWMLKTSPNHYEIYWPVSGARALPAFDLWGKTEYSERALQGFLDAQSDDMGTLLREFRAGKGDVVAGEGFEKHAGFMGHFPGWTPNVLILNHAMGLWALASHYRIVRDEAWLAAGSKPPLAGMMKAVDWIMTQRRRTMHDEDGKRAPHWGLLPPSAAHDWLSGSVIFNDAFCIFAMTEVVRMLRETSHPKAEEIAAELTDYRACLKARYTEARDKAARLPLDDGTTIPFVPRDVTELDWKSIDWTYTSYGPLRAGAWGAIDPNDELMDQTLALIEAGMPEGEMNAGINTQVAKDTIDHANWGRAYFEGTRRHFWRHYVEYELMWPLGADLFLQRDDLPRFFEWFFNVYAAHINKGFLISAESLNGVPGCTPGEAERWMGLRRMFVNERGGYDGSQQSLWLFQAMPRCWLAAGQKLGGRRMGTTFGGTIDLALEVAKGGKSCRATAKLALATLPTEIRMRLRSPNGKPLKTAAVDGKAVAVLPDDTIRLPLRKAGKYSITGSW